MIATKRLSSTESGSVVAFYMALILTPISLVPAVFEWVTPVWEQVLPITVSGLAGHAAVVCVTRSFAVADAAYVMPFDFMRLPFAAAFGFILFDELPDQWVWVGGTFIFASTYYIIRRETVHNITADRSSSK